MVFTAATVFHCAWFGAALAQWEAAPVEQQASTRAIQSADAAKILELLAESDPPADELASYGFDDAAARLGRSIPEMDPASRAEFARSLTTPDKPGRIAVLQLLTWDASEEVRMAALEALHTAAPDSVLRERVRRMSESDPSSLVRGYARLLAADWGVAASDLRFDDKPATDESSPDERPTSAAPDAAYASELHDREPLAGEWQSAAERPSPPTAPMPSGLRAPPASRPTYPRVAQIAEQIPTTGSREHAPSAEGGEIRVASSETAAVSHVVKPTEPIVEPLFGDGSDRDSIVFGGAPAPGELLGEEEQAGLELSQSERVEPGGAGFTSERSSEPGEIEPKILGDPTPAAEGDVLSDVDQLFDERGELIVSAPGMMLNWDVGAPLGYAGPSGVLPSEGQENDHFVPVEDRWRIGFPEWDRYGKGHPPVDDYPYVEGQQFDPFNQNVLKGDYPIIGQHTFLNLTATSKMLHEFKELPTATTPFESTKDPFQEEFFGDPFQYLYTHFFSLRVDLFHGNAAFKPVDWLVRITPVFNMNYLDTNELAIVNPDVRDGTTRFRTDFALEEWFAEAKIADLGPAYDFASIRAGSQFFNSDFRGFIFSDTNRAIRLFGTRLSNRDQFNIAFFDQAEKETNSTLNTFDDRHQNIFIANYYRQDFIFPGYTAQVSFHYNHDKGSMIFDKNDTLVRPDPAGVFQKHTVDAFYLGVTGDGHVGRYNLNNAFYWVLGQDDFNPIASRSQEIDAMMAAVELSYDRDWARFRTSYFYASGDPDANDNDAEGFDAIFDNPNFAGGEFTYWQRQAIRLFGVNLTNRQSLVPHLRSSKIEGQANFVNPGLHLINAGMDFDITPKLKLINNVNFLWFDTTRVLETFTFQDKIDSRIGTDLSMGIEYRPLLNDNIQIIAGLACLIPGAGFDDLFGEVGSKATLQSAKQIDADIMYSHFLEMILIF